MKKPVYLILLILYPVLASGQKLDDRIAPTKMKLEQIELLKLPSVNNELLLREEMERRRPGLAPRFAKAIPVNINPLKAGSWESISAQEAVWRLRIASPGAHSLNLGFSEFFLPTGASLILYSTDYQRVMGPFTPADNEEHAQLWTPIFEGDQLVVELRMPVAEFSRFRLQLTTVNHDFLGFGQLLAGACNLDVNCGSRDGWPLLDRYRDLVQSVAIYGINGESFCTGFLVNNGRQDCTPYFLTASHCDVTAEKAPSVVVYWNFENSNCRPLGTPGNGARGDGKLTDANTGAILRANYSFTDFTLLELDDPVSETAEAFFAGWSRENTLPADTLVCIHHPSSLEKRFSLSFSKTYRGLWGRGADPVSEGNHLVVPKWDIGTTEIGSSGAPLFDRHKRVVGQLHGGLAACNNQLFDQFGWFRVSWEGGGAPATSLGPWLDPDNLGISTLDGRSQQECRFSIQTQESLLEACVPGTTSLHLRTSKTFSGPVHLRLSGLPAGVRATFSQNPAPPGASASISLSLSGSVAPGEYKILIEGSDDRVSASSSVRLIVSRQIPAAPALLRPLQEEPEANTSVVFQWQATESASEYQFQLATDEQFQNLFFQSAGLNALSYRLGELESATTYFWRVRAANACGPGEWSAPFSFSTANIECRQWTPAKLPLDISRSGTPTVESTVLVAEPATVTGVRILDLRISHTFVGDLRAMLVSPSGKTITLFDRIGYPNEFFGCAGDDLALSFSDDAERGPEQLDATCEGNPAAAGAYRPIDSLSAFLGERAEGTWKLVVRDLNNQDGGILVDWRLELCIARPKDLGLRINEQAMEGCPGRDISFPLNIGRGFHKKGVALSTQGLPPGATVVFSQNPAPPGSAVLVSVGNVQKSGEFPLTFTGSDGVSSSSVQLVLRFKSPPGTPLLLSPANGDRNLPAATRLSWAPVAGVENYILKVAEDPDFQQLHFLALVKETEMEIGQLMPATTYYWRVDAVDECEGQSPSAVFSFFTAPGAGMSLSTDRIEACLEEKPSFRIAIGPGFRRPRLSYQIIPQGNIQLEFDRDTSQLSGGSAIEASIVQTGELQAGKYTIVLTLSEGEMQVSNSLFFMLKEKPSEAMLLEPGPDSILGTPLPELRWAEVPEAAQYVVEIARSEDFSALFQTLTLNSTIFYFGAPLNPGKYFWRIISRNQCGETISAQRAFSIQTSSAQQADLLDDVQVFPNPTSRWLNLAREKTGQGSRLKLFSLQGQLLWEGEWEGQNFLAIDLGSYPPGVYLLRFYLPDGTAVRRIVKQQE